MRTLTLLLLISALAPVVWAQPEFAIGTDSYVYAKVVQPDGRIVVGGNFATLGGVPRAGLARLDPNGNVEPTFTPQVAGPQVPGQFARVMTLELQPDGKILVGGRFISINGVGRIGIARLNTDGTLDTTFASSLISGSTVCDIALQTDGRIVIVGGFALEGGVPYINVARLNASGTLDHSFDPGTGADRTVYCVGIDREIGIVIGGWFSEVNGVPRWGLARLRFDGTVDLSFYGGVFMSDRAGLPTGIVYSLVIQPDRKIVIGGHFLDIALGHGPHTLIGGKPNFARLHADGNLDFSFGYHPVHGPHPGYFSDRPVDSVVLMPNGKVVASGDFEHVNGLARNGIARFFSNGTVDPGFDAGSLFHYFNPAGQLAVQPDGKVVAGVVSLYRLPSDGGGGTPPVAGVPQVTGVAPNPVGQGALFTIAGTGLALADSVVIGGVETYIEANTAQFITVMLDDLHPVGPGQIVEVTTPGGIDNSTQVDVVPGALPTITSVVPAQVYPGAKLTINGFNLTPTAFPMINGFYTDGVSGSATRLEVMVRRTQPIGLGQVLYVPGQNGKAAYASVDVILPPLPVLGPLSPDPVKQGEQLRISGDNLDTTTHVSVGGTEAAIVSVSKSQVVVTVSHDHPVGPAQSVKITAQFGFWDFGTVEVIAGPAPAPKTHTLSGSGGCASQSGSGSRAAFPPGLIAVLALLAMRGVNSSGRGFRCRVG